MLHVPYTYPQLYYRLKHALYFTCSDKKNQKALQRLSLSIGKPLVPRIVGNQIHRECPDHLHSGLYVQAPGKSLYTNIQGMSPVLTGDYMFPLAPGKSLYTNIQGMSPVLTGDYMFPLAPGKSLYTNIQGLSPVLTGDYMFPLAQGKSLYTNMQGVSPASDGTICLGTREIPVYQYTGFVPSPHRGLICSGTKEIPVYQYTGKSLYTNIQGLSPASDGTICSGTNT